MFIRLMFVLLIQVVVNAICGYIIPTDSIYGVIAYYMVTSFIISFIFALLNTPRQFRKDFYRHPGFHKFMLTYFFVFIAVDLLFLLWNL